MRYPALVTIEHIDTALMASAFELRIQPGGRDRQPGLGIGYSPAHGENIGIVVLPGQFGHSHIGAQGAADSFHLLAAIEIPMPVPQHTMPRSAFP